MKHFDPFALKTTWNQMCELGKQGTNFLSVKRVNFALEIFFSQLNISCNSTTLVRSEYSCSKLIYQPCISVHVFMCCGHLYVCSRFLCLSVLYLMSVCAVPKQRKPLPSPSCLFCENHFRCCFPALPYARFVTFPISPNNTPYALKHCPLLFQPHITMGRHSWPIGPRWSSFQVGLGLGTDFGPWLLQAVAELYCHHECSQVTDYLMSWDNPSE